MWDDEKLTTSKKGDTKFSICCSKGKISLPNLEPIQPYIFDLLTATTNVAKQFRSSIRLYNSLLAFTSASANVDQSLMCANSGVYTYRINGAVHHKISSFMEV